MSVGRSTLSCFSISPLVAPFGFISNSTLSFLIAAFWSRSFSSFLVKASSPSSPVASRTSDSLSIARSVFWSRASIPANISSRLCDLVAFSSALNSATRSGVNNNLIPHSSARRTLCIVVEDPYRLEIIPSLRPCWHLMQNMLGGVHLPLKIFEVTFIVWPHVQETNPAPQYLPPPRLVRLTPFVFSFDPRGFLCTADQSSGLTRARCG